MVFYTTLFEEKVQHLFLYYCLETTAIKQNLFFDQKINSFCILTASETGIKMWDYNFYQLLIGTHWKCMWKNNNEISTLITVYFRLDDKLKTFGVPVG